MCRCWKRKHEPRSHTCRHSDDSECSSRTDVEELEQVDIVNNDRPSWGIGFAVEVYSQSDEAWFAGQVIEVAGVRGRRVVKVVYNGKTKSMPVFSSELRPLETISEVASTRPFSNIIGEVNDLLDKHKPEIKSIALDAFLSYSQKDAPDAVGLLYWLLKERGVNTWFDQQQDEISVSRMSTGISQSRCFIIFLTESYFTRVFTVFELETALALEKEIIVVWEGDERYGGFNDFKSHMEACPEKYRVKLFEREALKFERRKRLQEAQIKTIADRISQAPTTPGNAK